MINFITVSGDWSFYRYFILMLSVHAYIFILVPVLVIYFWHKKVQKNLRDPLIKAAYIFIPFLFLFAFYQFASKTQVGADKWMLLAQAESTVLQLQVTNDLEKKTLPFDRQNADNWVKELREHTSTGKMSYAEFYALATQYNDLHVGLEDIRNWFKSNSTDSIRKELENNMHAMVERNQNFNQPSSNQAPQQQIQPQAQQVDPEEQMALEMENKLNAALQ